MNFYHPSPQSLMPFAYYAHLPYQGKQFSTTERRIGFGPLGVFSLWSSGLTVLLLLGQGETGEVRRVQHDDPPSLAPHPTRGGA